MAMVARMGWMWTYIRTCMQVRYVIDYYAVDGVGAGHVHIDARPALDSPRALYDRLYMAARRLISA